MNDDVFATRRALLSVSDKTGIVELAEYLITQGVQILSTGGTAALLREHRVAVTEVSDYTGFPEVMDGRLKTLHPKVHGGLLGRLSQDRAVLSEHHIAPIDWLVVNLYPFEQAVSRADARFEDGIENLDIGGPAMIRAAAKNHERVVVVVDPADYGRVIDEMRQHGGAVSLRLRRRLARKAFQRTAAYDTAIAQWLAAQLTDTSGETPTPETPSDAWPPHMNWALKRVSVLRYGENPHQRAAFYTHSDTEHRGTGLAAAEQRQGKALSYNNLADASVAYECAADFTAPACVVVKHANPCGVACAETSDAAYRAAVQADSLSAYGGIIAFNRPLDVVSAEALVAGPYSEVVIAPEVTDEALALLKKKDALRVLTCALPAAGLDYRSVLGGVLVQEHDRVDVQPTQLKVKTQRQPSADEMQSLLFAWRVVRFTKSNAIVFARNTTTVGIGAGQPSRVASVRIAAEKSREHATPAPLVMASDAFFPFRDGIDLAAQAGVTAIIQPGGSLHDNTIIAVADEHDIAMVFTGRRHFFH